ncbi:hypothetical protein B4U80_14222, partial [Leptotrombidium deliense]
IELVFGTDGEYFALNHLISLFCNNACPQLRGKGKVIILDGPRGDNMYDFRRQDQVETCQVMKKIIDCKLTMEFNYPFNSFDIYTPFAEIHMQQKRLLCGSRYFPCFLFTHTEDEEVAYEIVEIDYFDKSDRCLVKLNNIRELVTYTRYWETWGHLKKSGHVNYVFCNLHPKYSRFPNLERIQNAQCFCDKEAKKE